MTTINSIPADSEAAADWHVPAPHGLAWGPRRVGPPVVEVRPMLCAAMDATDPRPGPPRGWRQDVIRQSLRAYFWRGLALGAVCTGATAAAVFLALASGLRGVA